MLCVFVMLFALWHTEHTAKTKRLVTIYDRGTKQLVLTSATTVKAALTAANIKVDETHDTVEPKLNTDLVATYIDVIIYRSRPVVVADGTIRESVVTVAQSPNEILKAAGLPVLGVNDKTNIGKADIVHDGAAVLLSVERAKPLLAPIPQPKVVFAPTANALTVSRGAQVFVDSDGVAHRETYYDLPMNVVIGACGSGDYTIRSDGAKIDADGCVLVAANYSAYPRCTVVETSLGPGKVYDTGGFVKRYPYGFDLATDWTNYNGR